MRTVSPAPGRTVLCLLVPMVIGVTPALARQTTITGTVGTVVDYSERSYKNGDSVASADDGDRQKIGIQPEVVIVSRDVHDSLSLRYSPTLSHDYVLGENQVDHQLDFKGERRLSQFWSVAVTDLYTRSDDPQTVGRGNTRDIFANGGQTDSAPELSQNLNGRKYWTNTARASTSYAIDKDSSISGGYSYSVLRNDEIIAGDQDYDRHSFFAGLSHGFSPNWRSNLGVNYTRGLYDHTQILNNNLPGTPDLEQYGLQFGVDYVRNPHDFYPFSYALSKSLYDGDIQPDSETHAWSLGWDHAFDSRTRIKLGGGPAYARVQGQGGSWGYNAYLSLMRTYQHAALSLELKKIYEMNNFTGSSADNGLTDTYSARATFSYRHTEHLAFDMYGGYRSESNLQPQGPYQTAAGGGSISGGKTGDISYDKNIYEAGIGCSYSFARWYTAKLRYGYYVSDGKLDGDQYTDHQILFTLSASHDLWRW